MSQAKMSRRELLKEPDRVITTTARLVEIVQQNLRLITICVVGFLALGLVLWGWNLYSDRRERQAQDLQAQAYQIYRKAIEQSDEEVSKELFATAMDRFQEVIQNFDGTHASNMAVIYHGHASFSLGQYREAIQDYETALERVSIPEMKTLALQGLGYSLMASGDLDQAIETFEKLQGIGGEAFYGTVRWNIARCFERQGKVQNALEIYQELMQSSDDRVRKILAEAKVAELSTE